MAQKERHWGVNCDWVALLVINDIGPLGVGVRANQYFAVNYHVEYIGYLLHGAIQFAFLYRA